MKNPESLKSWDEFDDWIRSIKHEREQRMKSVRGLPVFDLLFRGDDEDKLVTSLERDYRERLPMSVREYIHLVGNIAVRRKRK